MAKVTDPLRSSEARGKVGALSYNTYRGRHTVKTCGIPTGQQTAARIEARRKLIYWSQRWQLLSADQRRAWTEYGNAHPLPDWTGQPRRRTGHQAYVGLSVNQDRCGVEPTGDPPSIIFPAPLSVFSALYDGVADQIDFTIQPFPSDPNLLVDIWRAGPHSAGRYPSIKESGYLMTVQAMPASPMSFGMTSFANVASGGAAAWTNPLHARFEDAHFALARFDTAALSYYLRGSNWLGAFPPSGTVTGFQISTLISAIQEGSLMNPPLMVRAGTSTALPMAGLDQPIPASNLGWLIFGGDGELCQELWTPEDINHPAFGFQFTCTNDKLQPETDSVDVSILAIYFTTPPPALLTPAPGTWTFHARVIDSSTGLTSAWLQAREDKPAP